MLGSLGIVREVGIYHIAAFLGGKLDFFQTMLNSIFAPVIADLHHRNQYDELVRLFQTVSKCLYKINFIFITKILQHPIHIIDQMVPTVVGGELNPFVLHKTPQYLNEVSFWRICWKVENQQPFSFPFG